MNFSQTFINWIDTLHRDAKTRLILSPLSDPISVLFSVRQGCPIAMLLFIVYIKPLLLQLCKIVSGYSLRVPILHSGSFNDQIAVKEKQELFVDYSEINVTNDSEFWAVDEMVCCFEQVSGAILNRSSKSKVMGLGCWKGQTKWFCAGRNSQ